MRENATAHIHEGRNNELDRISNRQSFDVACDAQQFDEAASGSTVMSCDSVESIPGTWGLECLLWSIASPWKCVRDCFLMYHIQHLTAAIIAHNHARSQYNLNDVE